ncbi:MAG: polyphosphate kinase 2 family protein [Anaerolineae bacterium]|nr:polyphosphate kinase 2 family protein [Anaerolineae bacterium]
MDRYRVKSATTVDLSQWAPDDHAAFSGDKDEGQKVLKKLNGKLEALQELLYAEGRHKLLIVLQAMDTGGKDGVIRSVFDGVNPQGVRVAAFKAPTPNELAHDYLWRVHAQVPAKGEMVIFNRSHYEDVLVVRVHNLVPPEIWGRRYEQINHFEQMLAEEGTTILKFFLHISKEEQKARLQARLDEPEKRWKFNVGDLAERALWDEYRRAYEDALGRTSTPWAPWYVVPADRKWYRDLVIGTVVVETLQSLEMQYPATDVDPEKIVIE